MTTGKAADWTGLKVRLESSERGLGVSGSGHGGRLAEVRRERARRLADPLRHGGTRARLTAVLVFCLGAERYAVPLARLSEVVPRPHCTPVPGTSKAFVGVVNLRGEVRPVINLATVLGLDGEGDADAGYVLLLRRAGSEVGLRVSGIEQVRRIAEADLSVPGDDGTGLSSRFVLGLTPDTIILLDTDAVLAELGMAAAPALPPAGA